MQTFLPYADFEQSARCLDYRRLGKQRVECLQIMKALIDPGYGWQNHPAVDYLDSYDAIIPLIQKQPLEIRDRIATKGGPISFMATPAQLAEKLLRATNRWTE